MSSQAHRAITSTIAALALPFAAVGCVTEGTAIGEAESAGREMGKTTLAWKSDFADPSNGTISGRMPDGTAYSGRYFQIVKQAVTESTPVDWDGYPSTYWAGWDDYGGADWNSVSTLYTGHVVANLQSGDGKRLRCNFILAKPTRGLAGGGTGTCTTSDGQTVNDVVLAETGD
ncbi:MAG: hypothetical protein HOV80_21415 [Polyangiaceae bacterium]|nr:hypothetical protein [Polyangiaceae bacterium]